MAMPTHVYVIPGLNNTPGGESSYSLDMTYMDSDGESVENCCNLGPSLKRIKNSEFKDIISGDGYGLETSIEGVHTLLEGPHGLPEECILPSHEETDTSSEVAYVEDLSGP
ncbi:hypothetical protein M758_UG153500 [Ceratodon purpureus]|nr:hypothetical protein M758_UG153500 [Ceratodon purpureus]